MEKRKNTLSTIKQCRFCLSRDESYESLRCLYDRKRDSKDSVPLTMKILSSVSVEVFPSDKMLIYICNRCSFFMDICSQYKQICRQADELMLHYLQSGSGSPLEPIAWPPSLVQMFRSSAKTSDEVGLNTVVEGGAMVEVTSHELSDSDEEDESVYNVKIGDGSAEGSACIKVVSSKDNENANTQQSKGNGEGFASVTKLAKHVRSHAGDRSYPCKHCDKTFIKSHHYTRHLRLKHRVGQGSGPEPAGVTDQYRCEQCDDTFGKQDDLIYHSAIHATQNLTCPLCQEKFPNVDAVTAHIKSHVNGAEFMCDYCELVFTSKEKLDRHFAVVHEEELQNAGDLDQNESSTEMDAEEYEEDHAIKLKEEEDHMVVEIKKANFILADPQPEPEPKARNPISEESESESTFMELATVNSLTVVKKVAPVKDVLETLSIRAIPSPKPVVTDTDNNQTASILRKAEEVKRKVILQHTMGTTSPGRKSVIKIESNTCIGANDKTLRLLEKELQELKRTTIRADVLKTPIKSSESLRSSKRPQLHTSTPKLRTTEEKKAPVKITTIEKKLPERRAVKENKEPKEVKETKLNNISVKEEKDSKSSGKEEREKSTKEHDTPKSIIKNGSADKSGVEDMVRRSTRPSKIKDYAKMIRESTQVLSDDDSDDGDDEYVEAEKTPEVRPKPRRSITKPPPKIVKPSEPKKRGRGRPRKERPAVPAKIKKNESVGEEQSSPRVNDNSDDSSSVDGNKSTEPESSSSSMIMSPTGQTLKKVPIKALPPGVKPVPLSSNARPMGAGELCEMQIGKKVVKVQKIVMTKAEVEAMTKKGLVEMKDGTMVLKQGIKLPTSDPHCIKTTLVGKETEKQSIKNDKGIPTRCEFNI